MGADQVGVAVAAAPEAVWAKVGDFGGIGALFPDIKSVQLEGDVRVLDMPGLVVRERLIDRDEAAMSLTYSVIDGVPMDSHKATVSVRPEGDGSWVTWAFEVTPDELLPVFTDTYGKALAVLAGLVS